MYYNTLKQKLQSGIRGLIRISSRSKQTGHIKALAKNSFRGSLESLNALYSVKNQPKTNNMRISS